MNRPVKTDVQHTCMQSCELLAHINAVHTYTMYALICTPHNKNATQCLIIIMLYVHVDNKGLSQKSTLQQAYLPVSLQI